MGVGSCCALKLLGSFLGFLVLDFYCVILMVKLPARHRVSVMVCSLTPLLTIFQLYRGGQFYWWIKRSIRRNPPICNKSLTNLIT